MGGWTACLYRTVGADAKSVAIYPIDRRRDTRTTSPVVVGMLILVSLRVHFGSSCAYAYRDLIGLSVVTTRTKGCMWLEDTLEVKERICM